MRPPEPSSDSTGTAARRGIPRPLRPLVWVWAALILALGGGAGVLAWLGPPGAPSPPPPAASAPASPAAPAPILPPLRPGSHMAETAAPARADARPIAAPDPALLEASTDFPTSFLPRIGADRRSPMQAYAAAFDAEDRRPRIALLIAGLGLSQQDSLAAINTLPRAVSLAVSPYAGNVAAVLDAARATGHELLASVPMEPKTYPGDDPGEHALLIGNAEGVNQQQLAWALTRFAGYVGATSALGPGLRGERFAASTEAMRPVLAEFAARGLLYIDARPGAPRPPGVVGRAVDAILDEPPDAASIDAKLAGLEATARRAGSAIGLASLPTPVTVARIAAWARDLGTRGLVLAPVSAVAPMVPAAPAAAAP